MGLDSIQDSSLREWVEARINKAKRSRDLQDTLEYWTDADFRFFRTRMTEYGPPYDMQARTEQELRVQRYMRHLEKDLVNGVWYDAPYTQKTHLDAIRGPRD